jgi:hypothetical protein
MKHKNDRIIINDSEKKKKYEGLPEDEIQHIIQNNK